MKSQPKELFLLNFVSMWECFSYYGMRVLLVLFMIHEFDLSDSEAFGFYALYTTLVEFGGVFGGMIADRLLGLKRTIMLGGWTIVCGHLSLIVPESKLCFYLGLGLIIVGTSLFRSNNPALIGKTNQENDPRRDAA
jgi:POT family proton-dependent oligopeptide transporter